MTPIEWAIRPLKRYADFQGRAPRAEYWWFVLSVAVLGSLLALADRLILRGPVYGNHGPLGLSFMVVVASPGVAVLVRRLHDTQRSGWWALVKVPSYSLVLAGSSSVQAAAAVKQLSGPAMAVVLAFAFGWLLTMLIVFIFTMSEGTRASNRFGPDPYGPNHLEEVFA